MMNATKADKAKSIPKVIDILKSIFSEPRRVWKPELKLSPAPKAPPIPVPVCWRRIVMMRRMESPICINGNTVTSSCI